MSTPKARLSTYTEQHAMLDTIAVDTSKPMPTSQWLDDTPGTIHLMDILRIIIEEKGSASITQVRSADKPGLLWVVDGVELGMDDRMFIKWIDVKTSPLGTIDVVPFLVAMVNRLLGE
jgi:hypothetical protein